MVVTEEQIKRLIEASFYAGFNYQEEENHISTPEQEIESISKRIIKTFKSIQKGE